jgi:hypothetical protein
MRTAPAFTLLAFLILNVGAASGADVPGTPWGVFSRSSADGRETTEVEISSVVVANTGEARPETPWMSEKTDRIWVARKRVERAGASALVKWADSRTCYPMLETLATLVDLDQPVGAPVATIVERPSSGLVYRLEAAGLAPAPGRPSAVVLKSGAAVSGGAVVDAALKVWSSCWSDAPPSLAAAS